MKREENVAFALKKTFFSFDTMGNILRYSESIAYFTDLSRALKEKANHTNSFVFPLQCHFHKDRRDKGHLIRATYHRNS